MKVADSWTIERMEAEIDRCLHVGDRHGDDIMWLMGFADLAVELELIRESSTQRHTAAIPH